MIPVTLELREIVGPLQTECCFWLNLLQRQFPLNEQVLCSSVLRQWQAKANGEGVHHHFFTAHSQPAGDSVGMAWYEHCAGADAAVLWYLAVAPGLEGTGYGSQMLRQVLDLAFRERNCGFVILEVESDAHGDMNRRSQIEKRNRFYMVRHGALQLTGVNYTQRVAYQEPIPMNLLLFVNPVLPRPEPEDLFSRAREIFGESLISVSDPGLSATLPCQD